MDFLSLYVTARLTHSAVSPIRMILSAAIGAIFALFSVVVEARVASTMIKLAMMLGFVICAVMMTRIAFKGTLRIAGVFGAVNVGLGGVMTAIYSMLGRVADSLRIDYSDVAPEVSPFLFALIAGISGAVSLLYGRLKERGGRQTDVVICACGREVELRLLIDSGNLLRDPISSRGVIIVASERLETILPRELILAAKEPTMSAEALQGNKVQIRLIPMNSVTGKGMMLGFVPDAVISEGRAIDAVVAIDPNEGRYGDCEGIIPEMVLL